MFVSSSRQQPELLQLYRNQAKLQHLLNRVSIIRSVFFFCFFLPSCFLIQAAVGMTFSPFPLFPPLTPFLFFFQSTVKSPKHVSPEHGLTEEANRLIPLGYGLIKSEKHEARLGPGSRSGDNCTLSQRSDRKVQEENAGVSLRIIHIYSKRRDGRPGGKIEKSASAWYRSMTCHQCRRFIIMANLGYFNIWGMDICSFGYYYIVSNTRCLKIFFIAF